MNDTKPSKTARGDPDESRRLSGRAGGGDSGGGAYPNPHRGREPEKDGFLGEGGQTGMGYHGHGRLGEDVTGENANSAAGGTRPRGREAREGAQE